MNFAYSSLIATVLIGLFYKNNKVLFGGIILTNILALALDIVSLKGVCCLAFLALVIFLYSNVNLKNKTIQVFLFFGLVIITSLLMFHVFPGFFNTLIIDQVKLSDLSCPFSMYLNFDKVMAALIIFSKTDLHKLETSTKLTSYRQTFIVFLVSVVGIISCAYIVGYIKFDPKLPYFLPIWVINNFFFVCFAEEVIFRGFIQRNLGLAITRYCKIPYLNLVIVSFLFGIAHFKGGIEYMFLSFISSFLYGYVYHITNRILCSMIVHFGVNLCHLLLFTYPALVGVC